MAGSALKTTAIAAGIALGSSGTVILVGIFVIGMLLLSLIPIYIPDNSVPPYGEVYRISKLMIKAIYTNVSLNFTGGEIVNYYELSNLCTAIYRSKGIKDFSACVVSPPLVAYGPTGNLSTTSKRRRRALDDVGLYEVGDFLLYYSTTCSNQRARGSWFSLLTPSQNSSCVAQRMSQCTSFILYPNNGTSSNQWSPFPNGFTQLIHFNSTGCIPISVDKMFTISPYIATNIEETQYNASSLMSEGNGVDCQLNNILSQADIQAAINRQWSTNTSTCSLSVSG